MYMSAMALRRSYAIADLRYDLINFNEEKDLSQSAVVTGKTHKICHNVDIDG